MNKGREEQVGEGNIMKKTFLILFSLISVTLCYAQVKFSCPQISADMDKLNALAAANKKDNVILANAIKDAGAYKLNADGSLEYVYIIESSDSVSTKILRENTFDFISYYFKMNNESRANMVTNSEGDGVFFQGKFKEIGAFNGILEFNTIHANMVFNIKFKPNRIRFSLKIEDYQVLKTGTKGEVYQNRNVYLKDTYPLKEKSDHKKSYAMAFVNGNIKSMEFAKTYVEYLNKHFASSQKVDEDW